eukprot:CAMPEP_0176228950 /NCGR_PEP_ID=MMETSP0121_2-20121125/23540_1 /TAXON_ID=160619 /ORGANISM="Kryptoperidinium foliaceum, Strain CCMP 1326" /LENGTH=479 /DNA_ID=CAMNT_0017568263 /DNA_START=81 /DNA_END=1521 /DNA_ORIENTATION=+
MTPQPTECRSGLGSWLSGYSLCAPRARDLADDDALLADPAGGSRGAAVSARQAWNDGFLAYWASACKLIASRSSSSDKGSPHAQAERRSAESSGGGSPSASAAGAPSRRAVVASDVCGEYLRMGLQSFHKVCWRAAAMGQRTPAHALAFPDTVLWYDPKVFPQVVGKIALTIDDAPCRSSDPQHSMMPAVLQLLREFDAQATFFLCTDYVRGHEAGLREAIRQGHEVANHCPEDRSYADETEAEFEAALLRAEDICARLRASAVADAPDDVALGCERWRAECPGVTGYAEPSTRATSLTGCSDSDGEASVDGAAAAVNGGGRPLAERSEDWEASPAAHRQSAQPSVPNAKRVRWFRAPHAKMSPAMRTVITRHAFTHVLTDCYANDPWISDADFISKTMLDYARDGGIAVIHMPEHGFRDYNLRALRQFLEGLSERGLSAVSLSSLHADAVRVPRSTPASPEPERRAELQRLVVEGGVE